MKDHRIRAFALGMLAALVSTPALSVSISQTPLFVSTSVEPNVMLQFDNSGSMDNIIWDDGYDPGVIYPNWANYSCSHSFRSGNPCWTEEEGSVILRQLTDSDNDDCNNDRVRGRNDSGVERCLRLPDPVGGGDTRYAGNYLNYLFETYATVSGDDGRDIRSDIPNDYRLQVAKQVATQIVEDNDNINFGLTRFNTPSSDNEGGTVIVNCGATESDLSDKINDLEADSNTPLAETYYEITRYFRGLDDYYGDESGNYESPIQYGCQKNFVIVITDGLPTYDELDDDHDDPDVPGSGGETLPDWDGLSPDTDDPPYPQYSDGTDDAINEEGSTLYLDDLAKFGYDLDLGDGDDEFEQQRLETYTVGFSIDNQMLEDAAEYGHGEYFTANNLDELTAALQGALSSIADKISTAASLAASSTEAAGETVVFQARFRSGDWSGELAAYPYESIGDDDAAQWLASEGIPAHDGRSIFTVDGAGAGIAFTWAALDAAAKAALNDDETLLDYIRGDTGNEGGGGFRSRGGGVLGDIIHSTPAFVGDQSDGYSILSGAEGDGYRGFVNGKDDYDDVVLVGANDGMLHAIDADSGVEVFAYAPRSLISDLPELVDQDYAHRYYVDGSPSVADAYIGGSWRTLAVTALGAGGPGAFALDATDPANFGAGDILWEIAPDSIEMQQGQGNVEPGDYLGAGMGAPSIVRTESGDWVAIFGNGYNSVEGTAALIVVDLASGEVLRVLDTAAGGDNGLATPLAIDRDRNGSVDTVYAGDLKGNLWKFDLAGDSDGDWAVEYGGDPLFTARDGAGAPQPITARPDAVASPHGGLVIVFGTGKYLGDSDPLDDSAQSVYGIWDVEGVINDDGTAREDTAMSGRAALQGQAVVNTTAIGDTDVRVISRNPVDYEGGDAVRGWFLDLSYSGERINRDVTVFDGKAIMVSTIPNSDPCTFGGRSALIEINPLTGTQFDEPILDINEDGDFDTGDGVADEDVEGGFVYPGMIDLNVGLATNPNILIREDSDHEKQITGSNLNTQMLGEKGYFRPGRASWQQIR